MKPWLVFAALATALSFSVTRAAASDAESVLGSDAPSAAELRYSIARELYRQGKYAEAAAEFDVALVIMPTSAKLAYNAARCHERAGNLELALQRYADYLRLNDTATDRADVEATIAAIRQRMLQTQPDLVLTSVPEGARVTVDDDPPLLDPTPVTARVTAGKHRVRYELAGHESVARTVRVVAGRSNTAHVELKPIEAVSWMVGATDEPPEARASGWVGPTGWTAVGLGAAGLAVGVAYTVVAFDKADEVNALEARDWRRRAELTDEHETAQTIQWVGLVSGAVLAAAGVALLLWPEEGHGAVGLVPTHRGAIGVVQW